MLIAFLLFLQYNYVEAVKMKDKTDLRVIKTNKILFEALTTLMKDKTFEKIKISDICEVALINRSTFYAHYEDKYELLLALIEDLKDNLLIELNKNEAESLSKEYFMKLLEILIDHINSKREIYSAILSHNKNGIFVDFLIDVANRDLAKRLKDSQEVIKSNIPADIISKFYLGGIINIGVDWIINKDKYNKEQILLYLDKLIPDKL